MQSLTERCARHVFYIIYYVVERHVFRAWLVVGVEPACFDARGYGARHVGCEAVTDHERLFGGEVAQQVERVYEYTRVRLGMAEFFGYDQRVYVFMDG